MWTISSVYALDEKLKRKTKKKRQLYWFVVSLLALSPKFVPNRKKKLLKLEPFSWFETVSMLVICLVQIFILHIWYIYCAYQFRLLLSRRWVIRVSSWMACDFFPRSRQENYLSRKSTTTDARRVYVRKRRPRNRDGMTTVSTVTHTRIQRLVIMNVSLVVCVSSQSRSAHKQNELKKW